jgi:NADH-quinone oxidoreductase subunit J
MSAHTIVFYILAALVLTFGALTVFSRKIFRAAVFLLFSLICVAGIYILMEMDFIAALQIVIYVGGIVVLIIFSIFLTHSSGERLPSRKVKHIFEAALLAIAGLVLAGTVLVKQTFTNPGIAPIEPSVKNIGRQLLDYNNHGYVLPFEIVSILLLAALVGSIVIAMKSSSSKS